MVMEIFSIYPHTGQGTEGLPPPEVPYYALAEEGLFLHRKTQIGTVLIKQYGMPKNANLGKIGYKEGVFHWDGPKIPGKIVAQATDFFRRIYATHKTEAEVIITMHNDTGEFRLFVPYQRVSGMGVKSIYEPTFIDRNYTVVGTLHSHCNFSAFHSGTDSADAADMDGIHFTIGMLERETPEIVAMVVMNKKEFHYGDPADVAEIDFTSHTAPLWWDQYVFPTVTDAAKPRRMRSITQEQWDAWRGITPVSHVKAAPTTTAIVSHVPKPYAGNNAKFGWYDDDSDWGHYPYAMYGGYQPTKESQKFNKKRSRWHRKSQQDNDKAIDKAIDDAIEAGIIMPSDWTSMEANQLDDLSFWQQFFLDKLDQICDILQIVNVSVEYNAKDQ